MSLEMNAFDMGEAEALEILLFDLLVSIRKIGFVKILSVSNGRATVEGWVKDVYLKVDTTGNNQPQPEAQVIKKINVPIAGHQSANYLSHMPLAEGDEALMLCADRSVAALKDLDNADYVENDSVLIHDFNGAFLLPIPISKILTDGVPSGDVAVFGSRNDNARAEFNEDAGEVHIKVDSLVKLAGATQFVARADRLNSQLDTNVTRINELSLALGTLLGNPAMFPPLYPLGRETVAMTKVKGE